MSEITVKKDRVARTFEMSIDIAAPAEAVWSALTEAHELVRWFPLEARVVAGKGGSMAWGWGGGWAGESRITEWEPNRRLTLVETRQGFDADGRPLETPGANRDLIVDVTLESHQGRTRLTLVHSGFGHGADWDDELDGVSGGWQCELRNLREYVERWRGRDRVLAWAKGSSTLSMPDVWQRLFAPGGLTLEVSAAADRYTLTMPAGERFEGRIAVHLGAEPGSTDPRDFVGYVEGINGGMLRVGTFRAAGRTGMMLWMVAYDPAAAGRLKAFEAAAQRFLDDTFAATACSAAP